MTKKLLTGVLLDERVELTLTELCRACSGSRQWVIELVDEGVLEPVGREQSQWRFSGASLQRARTAMRLQREFDIDLAATALVLNLLEELETLRERMRRFEA